MLKDAGEEDHRTVEKLRPRLLFTLSPGFIAEKTRCMSAQEAGQGMEF